MYLSLFQSQFSGTYMALFDLTNIRWKINPQNFLKPRYIVEQAVKR